MEGDEPADELPTFCFQHSDNNFTSGILQFLYASARNLGERISAPDNDAWNLLFDDEVCTRRSFAIVRTRFQADVMVDRLSRDVSFTERMALTSA